MLGAIGGLMGGGGGVMALGGQLMGAGLSMGQIQSVSKEMFAVGREKAGEDCDGRHRRRDPGPRPVRLIPAEFPNAAAPSPG